MEGDARFVGIAVLLHGLGETTDARAGLRAWLDAYGLRTAHERLKRPPVKRTSKRKDWSDERVQHVNRTLSVTPYRGFAAVCPYLPNLYRKDQPLEKLAKYADWIVDTVVPRAREVLGGRAIGGHLALCGCSFGGWVGLDVLLRRPGAFDAFVGVQSALYDTGAKAYAERLANAFRGARPLPIRMTTSTQDPFRSGNEALVAQCRKLGLEAELLLLPGPHDQGWLREGGTLETMIWLDRVLNGMPDAAP
jgi:pimeloyl-ACP methyl ester carboxylesterase